MNAPTAALEWKLARAAANARGLLHVVSQRDSGQLNPLCGAHPLRSRSIEEHKHLSDAGLLCDGCAVLAQSFGGTIRDGVALLLGLSSAATTTRLLELPLLAVNARPDHARRTPGEGLEQLVDSIVERGIVSPLLVRRHGQRYQVIDGVRRLYAATVAGLATIPAVVRDATDAEVLLDGLTVNLHRTDLNPIDLAHAYEHAIEVLGLPSKAELGRVLGISREQVSNTIRLLALPEDAQAQIVAGGLTAEGGRALLRSTSKPLDPQLAAIQDLLAQALGTKVGAVRTRGKDTEIVLRVPTAERDRWLARFPPAA